MNTLTTIAAFLVVIGILVTIHEFGHYWVARKCGIKVLRFSIGFGKVLWSKTAKDGVEWVISAIPLGGYVKMLDEREGLVDPALAAQSFNRQSLFKRNLVVLAGPVANLLLAIVLFTGMNMVGQSTLRPVLAEPERNSEAAKAGLQAGDELVSVGGRSSPSFSDARWALLKAGQGALPIVVKRGERLFDTTLQIDKNPVDQLETDPLARLGLEMRPVKIAPVIDVVAPDSAAARAQLKPGDRVLKIDGQAVSAWGEVVRYVAARPKGTVELLIEREGAAVRHPAILGETERDGKKIGLLGVRPKADPEAVAQASHHVSYGLWDAATHAVSRTWDLSVLSLKVLGRIVIGQASVKNISGPITMADYAGQTAKLGLMAFVGYLAIVSVSIGVLNLLPVPMLDGGHLMYHLAEFFKGAPLSDRALELSQLVGLGLVLLLMSVAMFNDLSTYVFGARS